LLDDNRIERAEHSLREMLGVQSLRGKSLVDLGSGSGLFSLAARRLGARVVSLDYDPTSVRCTAELRRRYFNEDPEWQVLQGSVLDRDLLAGLGRFDVVYSWGVLHHTGRMWEALANVVPLVAPQGQLFVAIYNDQGPTSRMWLAVKRAYNALPNPLRWLVLFPAFLRLWGPTTLRDFFALRPFSTWRNYGKGATRGMDPWRDTVDWVGGLPFEVARPEQIFEFYLSHGFILTKLRTCAGGIGCNEYVFIRGPGAPDGQR
jgi:2-polyprenyl-6-hydroxyphenyl methylase/3-demethylubiquinone-9 3-methyltransferase